MDHQQIVLDLIKDSRETLRNIQARIYTLSTTFVVSSFAITAFALKEYKPIAIRIIVFSDIMIAVVLVYMYLKIFGEHKLVRLAMEKQEKTLIDLLEGKKVRSEDVVAPEIDMKKDPEFSITREVNLFLWSAGIIMAKSLAIILCRSWLAR